MKVNVIREFVDKNTGELHKVGSSFDCSEARYKEIQKAGAFVEPAKEKIEKPSKEI